MRLIGSPRTDLTYCTNIHPGEGWAEIRAQLGRHLPAVKARVAPAQPFGVGLRMSGRAAPELAEPETLEEFRAFLAAEGLYVFTINGFPYGAFHGERVKERVYRPDWRASERLAYADACAHLLAALLPKGIEGSVSTVPVGYKADMAAGDMPGAAEHLLRHAATLVGLERVTGRTIALALEPEPYCVLETVTEAVAFFKTHLFAAAPVRRFADLAGLGVGEAEGALRRHLGLCLDACHAAVEFEDPDDALDRLDAAGIRIAKVQLSAGLVVEDPSTATHAALAAFAEDSYLHQVVERHGDGLLRYPDLPDALDRLPEEPDGREWRIHFHVPIWAERLGTFASTRPWLERLLERHRQLPVAPHLEVETYTWDVLPAEHRAVPVDEAIARELLWVRQRLGI
ncbi:MAG TPA: metabolite traffic protein EboE [Azospirillum sp.]|nr:metabolite traffic protein EboE [Azospirillum sp.]